MTAFAAYPHGSNPQTTPVVRSDAPFRADAILFAYDRRNVAVVCTKAMQRWLVDAWKHAFQTIEQGGGRTNLLEHSDPSDSSSD